MSRIVQQGLSWPVRCQRSALRPWAVYATLQPARVLHQGTLESLSPSPARRTHRGCVRPAHGKLQWNAKGAPRWPWQQHLGQLRSASTTCEVLRVGTLERGDVHGCVQAGPHQHCGSHPWTPSGRRLRWVRRQPCAGDEGEVQPARDAAVGSVGARREQPHLRKRHREVRRQRERWSCGGAEALRDEHRRRLGHARVPRLEAVSFGVPVFAPPSVSEPPPLRDRRLSVAARPPRG
jgi:hypothetical protein